MVVITSVTDSTIDEGSVPSVVEGGAISTGRVTVGGATTSG